MKSLSFKQATDRLLGHEGGYVFHPNDPGGETNWGISKRSYPNVDIRNLRREDAIEIYYRDFWKAGRMDDYHGAIAFQVYDAAVNHGIRHAIRMLQRAANVHDDGYIGPISLAAIQKKSVTDLLMLFLAERIQFWTNQRTWDSFGKGWARRAADNLRYGAEDT